MINDAFPWTGCGRCTYVTPSQYGAHSPSSTARVRLKQPFHSTLSKFIIIIVFTEVVYNNTWKKKHVSRVQSVAAVLYLQFLLHVMLFRMWNTMFCIFTLLFYEEGVQCPIWPFFAVPWFRAFPECCSGSLNDLETVPVSPIITGISFNFTVYMRWISIIRSLYRVSRGERASLRENVPYVKVNQSNPKHL